MKIILHVSCSPRGKAAESYRLSQEIIDALLARVPGALVVDRVIGDGSIRHIDEDYAISQSSAADTSRGKDRWPSLKCLSGNLKPRTTWSSAPRCTI